MSIEAYQADWRSEFLMLISDPSIAYLLLMAGVWALFIEFAYPGGVVPGVLGAIALLIAIYGLQMLPINAVGLGLLLLGLVFVLLEVWVPSFGVFLIGGTTAMLLGSLMLFDTGQEVFSVAIPVVAGVMTFFVLSALGVMQLIWRSRQKKVDTGASQWLNQKVVVKQDYRKRFYVVMGGVAWRIENDGNARVGELVRVTGIAGGSVTIAADDK